jgi:tRNA pseudouridine38-40 synthase
MVDDAAPPQVRERERFEYGVRLVLAYEGTEFHGWQHQPGLRTVQGVLDHALERMGVRHGRLKGASRTDSGVHAAGQVASFGVDLAIPMKGWVLRLNSLLPADVAVREAFPCPPDYDPRFDSVRKTYRYLLHCGLTRDPLRARRYWFVLPALARRDVGTRSSGIETWLDLEAMERAAAHLVGTHDFHAFRAANDPREYSIRTMFGIRLIPGFGAPDALAIEVEGNAFMKNMVRILVGTLLDVGRQRTPPEAVARMLEPGSERKDTGPTAPAHGLTLESIVLGRLAALETL